MPVVSTNSRCFLFRAITLLTALNIGLTAGSAGLAADITEAIRLYKVGQYEECSRYTHQAIDDGQYSETWRLLKIRADLTQGHYEQALETLDEALARHRTSIRLRWLGHQVCRLNGLEARADGLLDEVDELTDGATWRYSDPSSRVVLGQFYLHRGVDPKQVLDGVFNQLKRRSPTYAETYMAAGQLALDKHDYGLAAEQFQLALERDSTDPDIFFGLAQAHAASDLAKAQEHLQAALSRNPNHVDTLLFIVDHHIDAERYEDAGELLERVFEINIREPRAWAYRAVLAHLSNDLVGERVCRQMALLWWPRNPGVDALIGRKLSQKYRFAAGAAYQREALSLHGDHLPAKIQLSQDLLRLGLVEEGWQLAEEVYHQDGYNIVAHNLVTLQDNLSDYRTLVGDGFVVRMEPREAEIYGARVLELLRQARERLCEKYDVRLEAPVLVEIFPRQQDFAIRTFGLPGGDGFLGVCFGNVITANSPASQGERPANWQSVLWHELCHVVTLNKTNNKMPRWLSEGISVYEETQADGTWGQSMTPTYREMILGDELVPVSQLSAAFLNPPSPMHLQFAYYESSLVVEYLIAEYGLETLTRVLDDLAVGMPINESLARYTGSLELLDADFADFARRRAADLAPQLDWEQPELPRRADAAALAELLEQHPDNYWILQQLAAQLVLEQRWEEAKRPLERLKELYPSSEGEGSAYHLLAAVHRKLGETDRERAVLTELADQSADAVDAFLRLIELSEAAEDWETAIRYAERMLAVNPLQRAPHRALADAAERTGDDQGAVAALRVLAAMEPLDPADVHFRLARLLHRQREYEPARRHILMSLEEAPRFRAAHRQLLEILSDIAENEGQAEARDRAPEGDAQGGTPDPGEGAEKSEIQP